jgi:hypothetical protein
MTAERKNAGTRPPRGSNLHGDERGLIVSSILRIVLAFLLLGLAANEVGQIVIAKVRVSNAAAAGAQAGADAYHSTGNMTRARSAAIQAVDASDPGARVIAVDVSSDGAVTVTAQATSATMVIRRVSFLRRFGIQRSTEFETHSP